MPTYDARSALPDGRPGPWSEPLEITYDQRDVLLYAVGIGSIALRFIHERHPQFAVFPTFPIRWGGRGLRLDPAHVPPSIGPLDLDAERHITFLAPMPAAGSVLVRSRLTALVPRGQTNCLLETETEVLDRDGTPLVRMVNGSYRRGFAVLGDIPPFEGSGETAFARHPVPARLPDFELTTTVAPNQAHIYRLSGDLNALHIDPGAARLGGFGAPILHGLCTLGICARELLAHVCNDEPSRLITFGLRFSAPVHPGDTLAINVWRDRPDRILFVAHVGETCVISNGTMSHAPH
ncbi:MAG: hypothetical protein GC150_01195 [Rhizobiales bacterium]|nr:hypothetical protein [Hyphomicrobiales bacterium]